MPLPLGGGTLLEDVRYPKPISPTLPAYWFPGLLHCRSVGYSARRPTLRPQDITLEQRQRWREHGLRLIAEVR